MMHHLLRLALLLCLVIRMTAVFAADAKLAYSADFIPRFNIPYMHKAPVIDGKINPEEWQDAVKVMGVVNVSSLDYRDRPVSFWVGWDEQHLYIAARSDILPGHRLYRTSRERYTTNVVGDDALEFGIFMHDRNQKPHEVSSFLKIVLNELGSGEYMKLYPSIGQNMYNWQPDTKVASSIYTADGKQWWDFEMALDGIACRCPWTIAREIRLICCWRADLKNPEWQWLDFPSASGHLEQYGFPRLTLTKDQPYVQIERFSGLHDEKLELRSVLYNPGDQPVTVNADLQMHYAPPNGSAEPAKTLADDRQTLTIPAHGSLRFDVDKAFPGLKYESGPRGGEKNHSSYHFDVKLANAAADAPPVYQYDCTFTGTDKSYLKALPRMTVFDCDMQYNPVTNKLAVSGDTLDAQLPAGSKVAAMIYAVTQDGKTLQNGRITQYRNYKYDDLVQLPALSPGQYHVRLALVDAAGNTLVSCENLTFLKKDEAKEFSAWWNNNIGDTRRVLTPFTPLKVHGTAVDCTRRSYQLDGLGLPRQIIANGGKLLTRPARILLAVGGKEYTVPSSGKLVFSSIKDWRIEFSGQSQVAGIAFRVNGWMEQDGLVNLDVCYAPQAKPVAIDSLRVEWPVDGTLGSWMSCIGGVGGNFAPRTIGKVPDGTGEVWNTLEGIGKAGSTMMLGNFESNLWVGNGLAACSGARTATAAGCPTIRAPRTACCATATRSPSATISSSSRRRRPLPAGRPAHGAVAV